MKPLTLIAASLVALVFAATPAIAPGTTAQAKPIMVADCGTCAIEQPDAPALQPIPADCGTPNCAIPTPPALKLTDCTSSGCAVDEPITSEPFTRRGKTGIAP